jgi:DNA-binding transcriptional LysR family regulator
MNLQQLKTFCTVLNEKSMTAAAQRLFLTQPAVSQQIRQLEDSLGVEILVRGVRQVKPTAQGQLLYDYAQRIISLVQQAEVAIQTMEGEVSGPLRVGTLNSIGLHLIGPIFALFLKNNQNVQLKLSYGRGKQMIKALKEGDIDLAILPDGKVEYGEDPSDYDKELVVRDEIFLVGSGKDRSLPKVVGVEDLAKKPMILLTDEYPGFLNTLNRETKKAGVRIRPVFESSNVGTLKRVIESGLGWGFLPAHSIRKQLQTGRLQKIEVRGLQYPVDMVCYLPQSQKKARSTEVFLKALQHHNS